MSMDNNMNDYVIYTEAEVSEILSHFNIYYILDTISDNINNRLNFCQGDMPNIANSMETFYKNLLIQYPGETEKIKSVRLESYQSVIDILCNKFNISYNGDEVQDNYGIAAYLYDFLISRFKNTIVDFFTNFIYKEKNNLYDALNLDELKKEKSSSAIYTKKLYKNQKLAVINSNLEYVIDNICNIDISFDNILNNVYIDKNISKFIENTIYPNGDFFKENIANVIMNPFIKPVCITNIRLSLQNLCMDEYSYNINEIISQQKGEN